MFIGGTIHYVSPAGNKSPFKSSNSSCIDCEMQGSPIAFSEKSIITSILDVQIIILDGYAAPPMHQRILGGEPPSFQISKKSH